MAWENVAWKPEQEQVMYRDWGNYAERKLQLDLAVRYYDQSLALKDDDVKALYRRSKCKRNIAQPLRALEDSVAAAKLAKRNAPINLETCDALYELNKLEDCKVELHDNTLKFIGIKVAAFLRRLIVVDENFIDSIGETLGPFMRANQKYFTAVLEEIDRSTNRDLRPLWKILKDQEKCDVMSILEKEEELLSPREIARRERGFRVFNQIYLNKTWIDVLFLKNLRKNTNLLLPQSKVSSPFFHQLTNNKYDVLKRFLKMLQARSPLYTEQQRKCPDERVFAKHREAHLNRIQYQTRRGMLTTLRTVRILRAKGKTEKLAQYIEAIMGELVVLKTFRVMPWKLEFMTEVYNTLALAHADRYYIPENILEYKPQNRILKLLHLPIDKNKERAVQFVFGDKSTYQEADAPDLPLMNYKKFLSRMEKRMKFAKYSIERCYLLHEIARSHLRQNRLDECCLAARKGADEAKANKLHLWQFLSTMLICKSHALLSKIERGKEALDEAHGIVGFLNSPQIATFVDMCSSINNDAITLKKRTQSVDSIKKRRSQFSISSRISTSISHPSEEGDETHKTEQSAISIESADLF